MKYTRDPRYWLFLFVFSIAVLYITFGSIWFLLFPTSVPFVVAILMLAFSLFMVYIDYSLLRGSITSIELGTGGITINFLLGRKQSISEVHQISLTHGSVAEKFPGQNIIFGNLGGKLALVTPQGIIIVNGVFTFRNYDKMLKELEKLSGTRIIDFVHGSETG